MKNIKLFLNLSIILLFIISINQNIYAACQPGYSQTTITLTIGNCNYDVVFCYKCGLSYPGEVYVTSITLLDPNCVGLPIEQVIDAVYFELKNDQFLLNVLCPGFVVPPCDDYSDNFDIYWTLCWHVKLIEYNGVYTYSYLQCENSAYCVENVKFCWDPITQTYKQKVNYSLLVGYPDCLDKEVWEIELPTQLNQYSDCFIYRNTNCAF